MTTVDREAYTISDSLKTLSTYAMGAAHAVRSQNYDYDVEDKKIYQVTLSVSAGAEYHAGGCGYAYSSCYAYLKDGSYVTLCSANIAYGGNGSLSNSGSAIIEQKLTEEQIENLDYIRFSFSTTYEHHGQMGAGAGGEGWGSCSGTITGYTAKWQDE